MSNTLPPAGLRGAVDLSSLVRRANAPQPAPGALAGSAAAADPTGVGAPPVSSALVLPATDATFESVLELSNRVPVVVEFYAPGLEPALGRMITSYGGRLVLATVDGQANPQLAQAFQVREVPAVAAVVGGRPVNLFLGMPSDEEVRQVLDELLALAQQNGITGTVPVAEGDAPADEAAEPVEEPLPPHHQEAYDAITDGDYARAISEYSKAIAQNPRDTLAVAGLAQVSLLQRLDGVDASQARADATAAPDDLTAQLTVADLDMSAGDLEEAFARLLDLFLGLDADGRDAVRTRLLEYFEIGGVDDERVTAGRRALTNLLY